MTKKSIIKKVVDKEIWEIMQRVYHMGSDKPRSNKQKEFMKEITEYIYQNFGRKVRLEVLQEFQRRLEVDCG